MPGVAAAKGPGGLRAVADAVGSGVAQAFAPVGAFIRVLGEHMLLLARCVYWGVRPPYRPHLYLEAAQFIIVGSLAIISLVGFFAGAVMALQMVSAFRMLQAEGYASSAVGLVLALELAPVLTALMLGGRAGSGIATELGTMRITEQIDALETMAVSPIQYLVVPRVVIGTLLTPLLSLVFLIVGMIGAYGVAVLVMGVDHGLFIENFTWYVDPTHITQGLIKASVFGLAFTLIGCYQGYHAWGGGRGVGLAATRAVVITSVATLILDYFLSDILLAIL